MTPEVVIIGCGFLGEAAAALFSARGRRVLGLVRSRESLALLSGAPFGTALCDVTDGASVAALTGRLRNVPLAIHAVSSRGGSEEDYAALYRDGLRRVTEAWRPGRILFVSSTAVYGQDDGSWVTEESPACPPGETGRILLEAERIALEAGGMAARFSGLYGPGRSHLLRNFLSGRARLEPEGEKERHEQGGRRWINQIHRDDGAAALVRLGDPEVSPGLYNVTDNTPVTHREVYGWMAEQLSKPLPEAGRMPSRRNRIITSKRVANQKLRSLGWAPRYASYRDALPHLIETLPEENSE